MNIIKKEGNLVKIFIKILKRFRKIILNISKSKNYKINNEILKSQKKTVLLLSHSSIKGGATVLLNNIAKQIKLYDIQVVIITQDYEEMINLFLKESDNLYVCSTKGSFENIIKKLAKYNIIGCLSNSVMSGNFTSILKEHNIYTVSLIHEMSNAIISLNAEKYAQNIVMYSDKIIFPSEYVAKSFKELVPFEFDYLIKPQGLYYSFDINDTKETLKSDISKKYNISFKNNVILNVGTSNFRKGFDIFCDMASLDENNKYIWIGYQNNRFTRSVNKRMNNLFLINYLDSEKELKKFYAIADVFALTSREEPFGTVVIESFDAGVPVVAFNGCGGYMDIVKNNQTGILVNKIDSKEMLKNIKEYLNIADKSTMSNNCRIVAGTMNFKLYVDYLLLQFNNEIED